MSAENLKGIDEVEAWLHSLKLRDVGHVINCFHEHEIVDQASVSYLTEEQLKDMGILQIGVINKILNTPFPTRESDDDDEPPPYPQQRPFL